MKIAEIRDMPSDELAVRLDETKEELFNLRFQHATGQLENHGRLGQVRRDVARILSLQRERALGISDEPTAEQAEESRRRRAEEEERAEAAADERRGRRRGRRGRADEDEEEVAEAADEDEASDEDDEESEDE
ncbi:MAG TPA: 50S ribosomal protein L29 [Actinomycetota bacterium]|nr:50S ribosomal protein L29 [Actinomycetota bacterium]